MYAVSYPLRINQLHFCASTYTIKHVSRLPTRDLTTQGRQSWESVLPNIHILKFGRQSLSSNRRYQFWRRAVEPHICRSADNNMEDERNSPLYCPFSLQDLAVHETVQRTPCPHFVVVYITECRPRPPVLGVKPF